LTTAREALIASNQQNQVLFTQLQDQARKIADLEREVQRQASAASTARQALAAAHVEIEALRAQLPDAATQSAYDSLVDYLSSPSETRQSLRIAA
jgi:hypothetical protein